MRLRALTGIELAMIATLVGAAAGTPRQAPKWVLLGQRAGTDRVIRSVEFWYDANTARGRLAVVRLFGLR